MDVLLSALVLPDNKAGAIAIGFSVVGGYGLESRCKKQLVLTGALISLKL